MKILFIAYHFPPHGGAGVQRSLKFVKYLPRFGIQPVVLTGLGDWDKKWAPSDHTLGDEIAPDIEVVRTAWPGAAKKDSHELERNRLELAAQLISRHALEGIFVSMSPFTDAAFAARLSNRCQIPWIADLRDPWALDEFQIHRTRWHRLAALHQMRHALVSASLIVMNTPEASAALRRTFPEFASHRLVSITNGYDAEDFTPAPGEPRNPRFTIVHAGFLHTTNGLRQRRRALQYRIFGRVAPGVELLPRSHYFLIQALAEWQKHHPDLERDVQFRLVGEPRPADRQWVTQSSVASLVTFTGYLSHCDSLREVQQADLLFLPMHKLPPGKRATIVPGKTYEYLATGRPILAPVPAGDARDFLTHGRTGLLCEPDDVSGMLRHLREQFDAWRSHAPSQLVDAAYVKRFERRALTRQLADELHAIIDPWTGPRSTRPAVLQT